jgi:hypothetical protein
MKDDGFFLARTSTPAETLWLTGAFKKNLAGFLNIEVLLQLRGLGRVRRIAFYLQHRVENTPLFKRPSQKPPFPFCL